MNKYRTITHCLFALALGPVAAACDVPIEDDAEPGEVLVEPKPADPSAEAHVSGDPGVAARAAKRAETCESSDEPAPPRDLVPPRGVVEPHWRVEEDDELASQRMETHEPTEDELQAAREYSARFAQEDGTVRAFAAGRDQPSG